MIPKQTIRKLLSEAKAEMETYKDEVTIDHNNVVCEYRIKFLEEVLSIKDNRFTGILSVDTLKFGRDAIGQYY